MQYLAYDGRVFDNEEECFKYEDEQKKLKFDNYFSKHKNDFVFMDFNFEKIPYSDFEECCYFAFISDEIARVYSKYVRYEFECECPNTQGYYMYDENICKNLNIYDEIKELERKEQEIENKKQELIDVIGKMEKEMSKF